MTRYFKVVEIDREEFMKASGEDLDCIHDFSMQRHGICCGG